ncbi:STN domain-containing protein [Sphingopyxis sp. R3-92]|uniref:STN domain-containing protein n=1 Tax=Sphingopyxis sp. R3-92 TaxID=3158553 RepID=UPI003EE5CA4D
MRYSVFATPLAALLLATPVVANDDPGPSQPSTQTYEIPGQSLNTALARFAETSGVDVLVDEADVRGRRSQAVVGQFDPPQALRAMLDGTGLVGRFTSRRSAVISRAGGTGRAEKPITSASGNAIVLDPMEVTASRLIGAPRPVFSGRFIADMAGQIRRIMAASGIVDKGPDARVRLQMRIRGDGTLHQVHIVMPSADPARDARIVAQLEGVKLDLALPEGLPQPIRFDVAGR